MKYLLINLVLICSLSVAQGQTNVSKLSADDQKMWTQLKSALLSKNMDSTLLFFTDEIISRGYEKKPLKQWITTRWFNDKQFMSSLKAKKYVFHTDDDGTFRAEINVDYPKVKGEEGDGRFTHILFFKKTGTAGAKVYKLDGAG